MSKNPDSKLAKIAGKLGAALTALDQTAVTAESCTGGWIAKVFTDNPGSSAYFDRAFITYSNRAKMSMLGVLPSDLDEHGAVSRPVVESMARGARQASAADLALAVSGIAGPGGGSKDKPVGTVWFAWAYKDTVKSDVKVFEGDRHDVRRKTVKHALSVALELVDNSKTEKKAD